VQRENCALGGTRTPNLLIRSQMLYPLSYKRLNCSGAIQFILTQFIIFRYRFANVHTLSSNSRRVLCCANIQSKNLALDALRLARISGSLLIVLAKTWAAKQSDQTEKTETIVPSRVPDFSKTFLKSTALIHRDLANR
jgi:hypothetical protein